MSAIKKHGLDLYEAQAFLKLARQTEYLESITEKGIEYIQSKQGVSELAARRIFQKVDHILLAQFYYVGSATQAACSACGAKNRQIVFWPVFKNMLSTQILLTAVICINCLSNKHLNSILNTRLNTIHKRLCSKRASRMGSGVVARIDGPDRRFRMDGGEG